MISKNHLISHRFRGFSEHENSLQGAKSALNFGVLNLEFDIRVTRCGTPIIYHDEAAPDSTGRMHHICNLMASDFKTLGGTFAHIPTASSLFECMAAHTNRQAKFLVDIKDAGFENAIHALVCEHRLQDRVVYVSWLPNTLFIMHEIAPDIPLCLSHWCQNPDKFTRSIHKVYTSRDGVVPRLDTRYIHGERSGWFIDRPLQGEMRDMIKRTNGSVCVPKHMVSRNLVENYHEDGITVSTFGYMDWQTIHDDKNAYNVDQYFIDNKTVFETL